LSTNFGLMADSTGEGMSGATDVDLVAQKNLKKTVYNGSKECRGCGTLLDPFQGLHTDKCRGCRDKASTEHFKNRMAPK